MTTCAMTTKLINNKMCTFKILLSLRSQEKQRFWTIFLSALNAPPPLKSAHFISIVVSPALKILSLARRKTRMATAMNNKKHPNRFRSFALFLGCLFLIFPQFENLPPSYHLLILLMLHLFCLVVDASMLPQARHFAFCWIDDLAPVSGRICLGMKPPPPPPLPIYHLTRNYFENIFLGILFSQLLMALLNGLAE